MKSRIVCWEYVCMSHCKRSQTRRRRYADLYRYNVDGRKDGRRSDVSYNNFSGPLFSAIEDFGFGLTRAEHFFDT